MNEAKELPSISEQLEEVKKVMCDDYCKWSKLWDEEAEGMGLIESEICDKCPLNRL